MFYALDKNDIKVHISETKYDECYFCQKCNQQLKIISEHKRLGQTISEHFSHIGKINSQNKDYIPCTDHWHYCMSEWHCEWQERFPKECRECVVSNGVEKHIADVLINNTVIEFQHSRISVEEFRERNEFYTSIGYKVIWVFDLVDYVLSGVIRSERVGGSKWYWRSAPKFFRSLNLKQEKSTILLQLFDITDNDICVLGSVSNSYNEFAQFYLNKGYSVLDFVEGTKNNTFFYNGTISNRYNKVTQDQIDKVKDGKTIIELWNSDCYGIIVQNLINGKEMVINGYKGVINRENKNQNGKIVGKYSSKDIDGKYVYSKLYVVWDAEQPIWKLLHTFERKDIEYRVKKTDDSISKYNGCDSLTNIVVQNKKNNIVVYCLYNNKTYVLNFVDDTRYNAFEIDSSSGEVLSQGSENYFVYHFGNKKIWKIIQPENDT